MKAIVVGLGSMGRRRIRLLGEIDSNITIIGVDLSEERTNVVTTELGILCYNDLQIAIDSEKPDMAFVCTSPLSHKIIIDMLIDKEINVFTELNLVTNGYERYIKENKVCLFLSSTFLYRKDIEWIIKKIKGKTVNYIYHTGQYLPDWHPWEDYRKYFVGNKKSNGCREIMAIELPWIIEAFGDIESYSVSKDKMSSLEIDYPDNYMISIKHKNGSKGFIAVDVVSRSATRKIEIYNENVHISWDGRPDTLKEYDFEKKEFDSIKVYENIQHKEGYSVNIIENAYKDEIKAFLECVSGNINASLYSFEKDYKVLKLIDEIEG